MFHRCKLTSIARDGVKDGKARVNGVNAVLDISGDLVLSGGRKSVQELCTLV